MTIWKYPVHHDKFAVEVPKGGVFLSCQTQGENPVMWFMVDEAAEKEFRYFRTYPTGRIDESIEGKFLATFQLGVFVFHLFSEA